MPDKRGKHQFQPDSCSKRRSGGSMSSSSSLAFAIQGFILARHNPFDKQKRVLLSDLQILFIIRKEHAITLAYTHPKAGRQGLSVYMKEGAMFCPKCGSQQPDNAKFCGVCGYRFNTAQTNPPSQAGGIPGAAPGAQPYAGQPVASAFLFQTPLNSMERLLP